MTLSWGSGVADFYAADLRKRGLRPALQEKPNWVPSYRVLPDPSNPMRQQDPGSQLHLGEERQRGFAFGELDPDDLFSLDRRECTLEFARQRRGDRLHPRHDTFGCLQTGLDRDSVTRLDLVQSTRR